jgi:hypothetical protein
MKIKSRGLGKRQLDMNLKEFKIAKKKGYVELQGVTHAPITWETTIRIMPQDIGGMLRLAVNPKVLFLGVLWVLHIKPKQYAFEEDIAWERRTAHRIDREALDGQQVGREEDKENVIQNKYLNNFKTGTETSRKG